MLPSHRRRAPSRTRWIRRCCRRCRCSAQGDNKSLEARFDLAVNNTPAKHVFMAIVSGTRYSVLVHPDVSGNISLNLKDVTVFDALEAIREMYGYDYKVDGTRIYIQPLTLQTRLFQVNYLTGQREGRSSLRVASGSVADVATGTTASGQQTTSPDQPRQRRMTTTSSSDFWDELSKALKAIVGTEKGRSVVISPMSGVIVMRAMPDELRNVAAYLKASQISVDRQVILEAKIVEVQLNESFQSGVNWGIFKNGPNSGLSAGQLGNGSSLAHERFNNKRNSHCNAGLEHGAGSSKRVADRSGYRNVVRFGLSDQQLRRVAEFPGDARGCACACPVRALQP